MERVSNRYQGWLDEDVPYIVTQEEKAMFVRLTTDKDRERFIQDFRERSNPKPGRPDNAFERELRKASLRQTELHYPAMGTRDDRARICILYGPPDMIGHATEREADRH